MPACRRSRRHSRSETPARAAGAAAGNVASSGHVRPPLPAHGHPLRPVICVSSSEVSVRKRPSQWTTQLLRIISRSEGD